MAKQALSPSPPGGEGERAKKTLLYRLVGVRLEGSL
jgi:hypothetical protein